jgi:uncharacterized protein
MAPVNLTDKLSSKLTDIDRPSTWKKYRNGMCDTCYGGCCTMPVEVQMDDLVRLGLVDEEEARTGSPRKIANRLEKAKILRNYRASTGLFMFAQKSDRSCVFLGADRRCTVYEKRPNVCRKFPEIGPRPGFCPVGPKNS